VLYFAISPCDDGVLGSVSYWIPGLSLAVIDLECLSGRRLVFVRLRFALLGKLRGSFAWGPHKKSAFQYSSLCHFWLSIQPSPYIIVTDRERILFSIM
jgi:hypothetical protein